MPRRDLLTEPQRLAFTEPATEEREMVRHYTVSSEDGTHPTPRRAAAGRHARLHRRAAVAGRVSVSKQIDLHRRCSSWSTKASRVEKSATASDSARILSSAL
jgi:hypothetical protein